MKFKLDSAFKSYKNDIRFSIDNFKYQGSTIYKGSRNELKVMHLNGLVINIKKFKTPNFINRFAYRWIRDSKAERSYKYAKKLLKINVLTPSPIGYLECYNFFGLNESYYISVQQPHDFTFRDLIKNMDFPDRENIIRAFTRFTFFLQNQNVFFIDHSPGNTLIRQKSDNEYEFYLVDLNRMKFKTLTFEERVKNFAKLSTNKELYIIIADEYAKLTGKDSSIVFDLLWDEVQSFRKKIDKKQALKKRLFLKKSVYET
jgi:hypothetical protein